MSTQLSNTIENGWDARASITPETQGEIREAVEKVLSALDAGKLRVAEKKGDEWVVNQWVKKAILLSFRLNPNTILSGTHGWYDKVPLKAKHWSEEQFKQAGFRAVPGSVVRYASFVDTGVVLMPSFVNIGAYVGSGTMVDTWATIGSCAQIGKNCHISGGVGIGGVLEPLQANPVIIEDHCFIGARSEVAEGVIVEEGAVISMGVFLGASTKIVDRATGDITYGRVPAYSVVVPGVLPPPPAGGRLRGGHRGQNAESVSTTEQVPPPPQPSPEGGGGVAPSLACAVIVKRVDEKTRSKTSINELLRD